MDISKVIHDVLTKWSFKICHLIETKWNSTAPQWDHNVYFVPPHAVFNSIVTTIVGNGVGAHILEFGSGSKLDKTNPYLQRYLGSDYWNDARKSKGNAFLGRAKGETVFTPDGQSYESSGKAEGLNLEWGLESKNKDFPPFIPQEAMHIMRNEVEYALPLIAEDLSAEISKAVADEVALMFTARIYL